MKDGSIRIRGARQNNLAGVDVELPRGALIAITGVSGSGKSSLAFDTLFREGQRRFLETLSAYARQFLGQMQKPEVDSIEGLSPAIAVDQKTIARGSRSTVGTLTEIVDHLRVLFARAGQAHCPECDLPIESRTPEAVVQEILRDFAGRKVQLLAPLVRDRKGQHRALLEDLRKKGFVRARVDGEVARLEEVPELARYERHTVEVVVDRLRPDPAQAGRLREAVEQALELGEGDLVVLDSGDERRLSTQRTCPGCSAETPPLEPRLFSFNSPHGACPRCGGLGELRAPTEAAVVRDAGLSIRAGALAVTRASGGALLFPRVGFRFLESLGRAKGFDLDTPWRELSSAARRVVLYGAGAERFTDEASWNGARFKGSVSWKRRYRGVIPALERAWKRGQHKRLVERYLAQAPCPECEGSRLRAAARAVRLAGLGLADLTRLPISELVPRLQGLELGERQRRIARDLLAEIARRADFLLRVGLGYLSLERGADSLSGGEAQRIRLAAQLGAGLQGVLYVLDEPSIGLHARDHERLLEALAQLRDAGNTVVVVEHDEATLRRADWIVDVGPGAGRHGGEVVAYGPPREVARADTPTGRLLRGEIAMPAPERRRAGNGASLQVVGARAFNLKELDVALPLGTLTAVTGVSGSGKSTLVDRTLRRAILRHLGRETADPGEHDALVGLDGLDDLVSIDASPIGRTTRSNPATYTKVLGPIRDLFALLPEAQMRGYTKSRFSFNVAGGRCEACQGGGARYVELQFLAPVTVPCEECGGHRFQHETLDVRYRGRSIADVLAMTIEEAGELFRDVPKIARPLEALVEVGIGYLTLGQPSTTLSGGEAQRVKLAKHLQKRSRRHTLYLLDEPTTGLHHLDVQRLVGALQGLVDQGHTVVVIEHMIELVRAADRVIDLGPEGGDGGGRVVVSGTPEEVEACAASHTGAALRSDRVSRERVLVAPDDQPVLEPRNGLVLVNARTHNLKGISLEIPRDALTVITGPSGSGKSSLALDTIHASGRQRFVESLSTYARQFLASRDRPPVDRIEGLGPSVAVEARTSGGHPRSTVATQTEIHDHLRVLWARAGTRRCPEHLEPLVRTDAGGLTRAILASFAGTKGWIVAPILGGPWAEERTDLAAAYAEAREEWIKAGYVRALLDDVEVRLAETAKAPAGTHRVDLVVDRLAFDASSRARIAEAVESAEALTGGQVSVLAKTADGTLVRRELSTHGACTQCGFRLAEELEPRHFSFNAHVGACPSCDGLGESWQCDDALLVDDESRPLVAKEGGQTAIGGKLGRYLTKGKGYYEHLLLTVARAHEVDLAKPVGELSEAERGLLLHGKGARKSYDVEIERSGSTYELHESFRGEWPGLCGHVDAWHAKSEDPGWRQVLEKVMTRKACAACAGERLAAGPRAVTVGKKRLPEVLRLSVGEALTWLAGVRLRGAAREAVAPVIEELRSRIALLEKVGLGYVSLDRATSTLSGGEARRVRLSASLGSQLVGVCYVLDEPTVGLHPQDVDRLTDALLALRDGGNTVLVVEHDESLMRRADHLVDMGPGAGRHGGEVVASGTPAEVQANGTSTTARALRGEFDLVRVRRADRGRPSQRIRLAGARLHNLRGVAFEAPFGTITGVCGPSGSGKSTLILECLVPALRGERPEGRWTSIESGTVRPRVVVVDASPIGRTPKSVPATAVGLLQPLRELFARTPEARMHGYTPHAFSFNSSKGRCPACEGLGATKVEMQFLADLWLTCEECDGRRYRPEIRAVHYRGRSIADVLALSVDEAAEFLAHVPRLASILETLRSVGLGYLTLGQSSTTLSAGEAQRVKLAAELCGPETTAPGVVVLDEPTTGLAKSDVAHLHAVLERLAARGDAVIVIEHQVDLLRACEHLVELGPAGGEGGGRCIATGAPEELAANPASVTGPWLALARAARRAPAKARTGRRGRKVAR